MSHTQTRTNGREILALYADAQGIATRPRLSGRFPGRGTLECGQQTHLVRVADRGAFLLIRSDGSVRFVPGEVCSLDGRAVRLLRSLDGLDPSRRAHLSRKLSGVSLDDAESLLSLVASQSDTTDALDDPGGETRPASPAARALLESIRAASRPGGDASQAHLTPVRKRGLGDVVDELIDAGSVVELENGHLIDSESLIELAGTLREGPVDFRGAARRWGCSNGRARAILHRMLLEELVRREASGFVSPGAGNE